MEKETAKRMSDGKWLVRLENGDYLRVADAAEAKKVLGVDGPND